MTLIRPVARLVCSTGDRGDVLRNIRAKLDQVSIKPPPELSRGRARLSVKPIEISNVTARDVVDKQTRLPPYLGI
jgi:hypothetical protein